MNIRKKLFQILYFLALTVFGLSCALLAARLSERRLSGDFYEAEAASAASVMPASEAGGEVDSQKLQESLLSEHLLRFAEEYPEAAVWIQIPGTQIDYPVMLGADNEFYLDHLPDGSKNALGSLFLDCRVRMDGSHLVVYGHNGVGGRMFGSLKNYESEEYLTDHPTILFAAPEAQVTCPIFSVRRVEAGSDAYTLTFSDEESLMDYIEQAAEESLYPIEADTEGARGILTLSTCTGWHKQRLIVQALLP